MIKKIREGQKSNPFLLAQLETESLAQGKENTFTLGLNGVLRFQDKNFVPSIHELIRLIIEKGHRSNLSIPVDQIWSFKT